MNEPAYPAARAVASQVRLHFSRHLAEERARGTEDLAWEPDTASIEAVVDAAFWASLLRQEHYPPKFSLAFLPPEQSRLPLTFEQRLPLIPESIARLAPAVERPGIHLGVWRENEEFHIWGATRTLPVLCFVVEVVDPGLLVIKHRRGTESGKFVNVAVLEGDQIKVLDRKSVSRPDAPALVASLLGLDVPSSSAESIQVLIQIAASMRTHRRGGSMLIVPHGTEAWRESIVGPTPYSMLPPYSELAGLIREEPAERSQRRWQEALRRAVDAVAGLTAVDGAMVITDRCELLAFGAKIGRRDAWARIDQVVDTELIEGALGRTVHPAHFGGARHLSAAQFAQDQINSVALVASQDGRFTVFAWSAARAAVCGYRVEALLL
ncbi:MAG TPA: hypothetical protein VGP62_20505 [Bryobacteraceae bacterium]|jgi:hypothetical protein|nr:hypothetical protein [Bryobacteraceae bacterium]